MRDVGVIVRADVTRFNAAMIGVRRTVKETAAGMKAAWAETTGAVRKHGAELDKLGTGMLKAGALVAGGLALSAKAAMSWESAFAGVRKTVDELDPAFAGLEGELRGMARSMATSHEEIAAVAESAGALGVATRDIAGFTRTMVILGETTNVTAEEASTSMAQLMTIMGTAPGQVSNLAAALVDLGNNGASTEAQILEMSQRLAGAGRAIGLTESQVMGFASAIASTGMNVEAGGSAMSRVFTRLDRIVTDAGEPLERINDLVGTDFAEAFRQDASGAITMFIQALGRLQDRSGSVTEVLDSLGAKGIYETDVIRRLAGAHTLLADQLGISSKAMADGTAHLDEYRKRMETTESQVQVAWNNIKDAAIEAGSEMLPMVEDAAVQVAALAQAFGGMPGPVKSAAVSLAGVTAATLLLGGGAAKGIKMVSDLSGTLTKLGLTATAAKFAVGGIGLALAAGAIGFGLWADAAAKAQAATDEFAPTLDVVGDKANATAATFDAINTKLVQTKTGVLGMGPSVADILDEMGVSAQLAQDYILGTAGSTERLQAAISSTDSGNYIDLLAALGGIRDSMSAAERQALQKARADQTAGSAAAQHASDAASATGAVRSVTAAMSDYTDEVLRASNAQLQLSGSHVGFEASIDAAAAAVKENGKTLDIGTEKGRANRQALDQIAASGLAVVESMRQTGKSGEEVQGAMQRTRDEFVKAATAMTGSKKTAEELADELGLIPEDVFVKVNTELDRSGIDEWNRWQPRTKWGVIKTKTQGVYESGTGRKFEADGGILQRHGRRLRQYMADGGFPSIGHQRPRIERNHGPAGITWAETGAGPWEAFVSGHPGKRDRSRAVTEEVAGRLGGAVAWRAADGGLREFGRPVAAERPGAAGREYGRPVGSPFGGPSGSGATVNVTTYYPVAEPVSVTTNQALQYAAALGEI